MNRILIVDDSETARGMLRRDLESEGYAVDEATDGALALEKILKDESFSLVICDLIMPRMDGYTFVMNLNNMLERASRPALPVFILTTDPGPSARTRAKELAIRAFILKPYTTEKLIGAVRKVLAK